VHLTEDSRRLAYPAKANRRRTHPAPRQHPSTDTSRA